MKGAPTGPTLFAVGAAAFLATCAVLTLLSSDEASDTDLALQGRTLVGKRSSSTLQAGSAECHNSHSDMECWGYKKVGMCQRTHQKWMRQHCALTCGFCDVPEATADAAAAAADLERSVEKEMAGDMEKLKTDLNAISDVDAKSPVEADLERDDKTLWGCRKHSDCKSGEYCYDGWIYNECTKCSKYPAGKCKHPIDKSCSVCDPTTTTPKPTTTTEPPPEKCEASDCNNHGTASGNRPDCSCTCDKGFEGEFCGAPKPTTTTTKKPTTTTTVTTTTVTTTTETPKPAPFWFGCAEGSDYKRLRTDWQKLTSEEKDLYFKAVNKLKTEGQYELFVRIHGDLYNKAYAHGTSGFLPWHRKFLLEYENALRASLGEESQCITIPYWDWAEQMKECDGDTCSTWLEGNPIIADFGGGGRAGTSATEGGEMAGCMQDGPFAGWSAFLYNGWHDKPKDHCLSRSVEMKKYGSDGSRMDDFSGHFELLKQMTDAPDYKTYSQKIEGMPHAMPHNNLIGHMRSFISPFDPLFFSHHAMVDKMWAIWQDCHDYDKVDYTKGTMSPDPNHYEARTCQGSSGTFNWGQETWGNACYRKHKGLDDLARGQWPNVGVLDKQKEFPFEEKMLGPIKTGKLVHSGGELGVHWMSDEFDTPMPFWYPGDFLSQHQGYASGQPTELINMCSEKGKKLIPTWTVDDCTPRLYLSTTHLPGGGVRYIPDDFEAHFNEQGPDIHKLVKEICTIEPPQIEGMSLSLEKQMQHFKGTVIKTKSTSAADLERLPANAMVLDMESDHMKKACGELPSKSLHPKTQSTFEALKEKLVEMPCVQSGNCQKEEISQCLKDGPVKKECEMTYKPENRKKIKHMPEKAFMGLKCHHETCAEAKEKMKKIWMSLSDKNTADNMPSDVKVECEKKFCFSPCVELFSPGETLPEDPDAEKLAKDSLSNAPPPKVETP